MHAVVGAQSLTVTLFGTVVGSLTWLPTQKIIFVFSSEYLENPERPTLSLSYKNYIAGLQTEIRPTNIRLPPFFSNLLPEGKLRTYLSRKANVNEAQEFFLLAQLAEDLPGAVRMHSPKLIQAPSSKSDSHDHDGPLRYSLAGVQLKLSGDLTSEKFVIPLTGAGGHWILKLPVPALPRVNELEYSMLTLAKHVGINVPEIQLLPLSQISGIPSGLPEIFVDDCLISRRFDRADAGARIHTEDFCQVFAQYDKYNPQFNYQSIASVIWSEGGLADLTEFVRRLVFSIAIGNADMHLKNWTLIYPDRKKPRLSPAYDFLPSAPIFPHTYQKLALKLAGENRFNHISIEHFKKMAAIARLPERAVIRTAEDTAIRIFDSWTKLRTDLPLTTAEVRLIEDFLARSTLMHTHRPTQSTSHRETPTTETQLASRMTGIVLDAQPELLPDMPEDNILYQTEEGRKFILPAPRRMVRTLLMTQLQTLLQQNPELNMRRMIVGVGPKLFFEWHDEHIPRVDAQLMSNPIVPEDLTKSILSLTGRFFPKNFAKFKEMHDLNRLDYVDFLLSDRSFWSCYCQIQEIELLSTLPDGRRFAKIEFAMSDQKQIAPPSLVHRYIQMEAPPLELSMKLANPKRAQGAYLFSALVTLKNNETLPIQNYYLRVHVPRDIVNGTLDGQEADIASDFLTFRRPTQGNPAPRIEPGKSYLLTNIPCRITMEHLENQKNNKNRCFIVEAFRRGEKIHEQVFQFDDLGFFNMVDLAL